MPSSDSLGLQATIAVLPRPAPGHLPGPPPYEGAAAGCGHPRGYTHSHRQTDQAPFSTSAGVKYFARRAGGHSFGPHTAGSDIQQKHGLLVVLRDVRVGNALGYSRRRFSLEARFSGSRQLAPALLRRSGLSRIVARHTKRIMWPPRLHFGGWSSSPAWKKHAASKNEGSIHRMVHMGFVWTTLAVARSISLGRSTPGEPGS